MALRFCKLQILGPRATSWIVSAQYGSVARVADERSPYLLDPSLPIFERDPSSEPATEQLLITDASNLRFAKSEVVGTWGLNLTVPGELVECDTPDNARSRCGYLVTFSESGLGSLQGRMPFIIRQRFINSSNQGSTPRSMAGTLIAQGRS